MSYDIENLNKIINNIILFNINNKNYTLNSINITENNVKNKVIEMINSINIITSNYPYINNIIKIPFLETSMDIINYLMGEKYSDLNYWFIFMYLINSFNKSKELNMQFNDINLKILLNQLENNYNQYYLSIIKNINKITTDCWLPRNNSINECSWLNTKTNINTNKIKMIHNKCVEQSLNNRLIICKSNNLIKSTEYKITLQNIQIKIYILFDNILRNLVKKLDNIIGVNPIYIYNFNSFYYNQNPQQQINPYNRGQNKERSQRQRQEPTEQIFSGGNKLYFLEKQKQKQKQKEKEKEIKKEIKKLLNKKIKNKEEFIKTLNKYNKLLQYYKKHYKKTL
jgi:hypothetical protein